jgi:hypothetical protein
VGSCTVQHSDALSVEHTKRDGEQVRRRRPDGSLAPKAGAATWARYRRALNHPDHGMVLRCFNCHFMSEWTFRRRHLKIA